MEEQGLVGLEARSADGAEVLGRISEVVTDEETGEVTHVLVEGGGGIGRRFRSLTSRSTRKPPSARMPLTRSLGTTSTTR